MLQTDNNERPDTVGPKKKWYVSDEECQIAKGATVKTYKKLLFGVAKRWYIQSVVPLKKATVRIEDVECPLPKGYR